MREKIPRTWMPHTQQWDHDPVAVWPRALVELERKAREGRCPIEDHGFSCVEVDFGMFVADFRGEEHRHCGQRFLRRDNQRDQPRQPDGGERIASRHDYM